MTNDIRTALEIIKDEQSKHNPTFISLELKSPTIISVLQFLHLVLASSLMGSTPLLPCNNTHYVV